MGPASGTRFGPWIGTPLASATTRPQEVLNRNLEPRDASPPRSAAAGHPVDLSQAFAIGTMPGRPRYLSGKRLGIDVNLHLATEALRDGMGAVLDVKGVAGILNFRRDSIRQAIV